ncbi:MAG TPA: two-component system regulatory protein YycI [Bacillota bacterium]|nr:two-component system regulatory protein YycI [Bacillota bacterium]
MDWTKAKTILIIALLITNIFLLVTYTLSNSDNETSEEELLRETIALLEEKNIYVKGELPSVYQKMPVLMVQYDRLDPDFLHQKLAEQIPMERESRSRKEIVKRVEAFLKDCGIWSPNVILDKVEQQDNKTYVHYKNEYEGYLVEDSYIICTVENGVITEVDRFWLKPKGFGQAKKATISASAALLSLMREKDQREAILVEDMELVYWLNPSDYEGETAISDTALPAWKITYNDGKVKHISAYKD